MQNEEAKTQRGLGVAWCSCQRFEVERKCSEVARQFFFFFFLRFTYVFYFFGCALSLLLHVAFSSCGQ